MLIQSKFWNIYKSNYINIVEHEGNYKL